MKENCWEFMRCGREKNGYNTDELGVCPATISRELNKIHEGKNAGRCCWVVAGTFCEGKPQGTFAQKYESCHQCIFYKKVQEEETEFQMRIVLLNKLEAIR